VVASADTVVAAGVTAATAETAAAATRNNYWRANHF
jgi:hypothetical protein